MSVERSVESPVLLSIALSITYRLSDAYGTVAVLLPDQCLGCARKAPCQGLLARIKGSSRRDCYDSRHNTQCCGTWPPRITRAVNDRFLG
jgi:hypothetical protein